VHSIIQRYKQIMYKYASYVYDCAYMTNTKRQKLENTRTIQTSAKNKRGMIHFYLKLTKISGAILR